jgi:hypothetical protein
LAEHLALGSFADRFFKPKAITAYAASRAKCDRWLLDAQQMHDLMVLRIDAGNREDVARPPAAAAGNRPNVRGATALRAQASNVDVHGAPIVDTLEVRPSEVE